LVNDSIVIIIKNNRVFGLDLLRAVAISLVVISHITYLLFPVNNSLIVTGVRVIGAVGVDLFFVLSGFLIGKILLKKIEENKTTFSDLITFWKRRWLRTLPNYAVVLIINVLIFILLKEPLTINLKLYPLFLQNMTTAHPNFFTEAWSLSVEEYAYLVLPIVLYITFYICKKSAKLFLWTTLAFIVFGLLLKINFYNNTNIHSYKEWSSLFRKVVIYRLDAIYVGFLLIYLYQKFTIFFKKYRIIIALLGGVIFLGMHAIITLFHMEPQTDLAFYVFVYLQLLIISLGMLFPYVLELKTPVFWIKKIVEYVSTRSYAIYLINYSIILLGIQRIICVSMSKGVKVILFCVLTLLLSELMYAFIELPVLRYRDKKYKR